MIQNTAPVPGDAVAPMVSVVTIFFNAERFIQAAIESAFSQTYRCWELLLVDDGSSDRSSKLARQYAAEFPEQVRYYEHPGHRNAGMSASRNEGIRHAAGRYVAFLDADDVWLPHKLEQQVEIMEANPQAAMVFGAPVYWFSWTGSHADARLDHTPPPGAPPHRLYHPPELALKLYPLGGGSAPCPSDLLVRRTAFSDVGLFEESFRGANQMYEDQAFLAKMYVNGSVYVSDERWIRYRRHPESCIIQVSESGQYDAVRGYFLEWLEQYLSDRGQRDIRVWLALQRAFAVYRHPTLSSLSRSMQRSLRSTPRRALRVVGRVLHPRLRDGWSKVRSALEARCRAAIPPPGRVRLGDGRRIEPFSRQFGFDRGLPIDRHYIEQFLDEHASDIRGRVIEIGDDGYTRRYGGSQIETCDILHIDDTNPRATIVADLSRGDAIPSDTYDCVILTQTLHLIFDLRPALRTLYRILKPGGVVLATVPGISQISDDQWGKSWFWGFTSLSIQRLFGEAFDSTLVLSEVYGNVLSASAFLHGMAAHELLEHELSQVDPAYQVIIGIRATKARVVLA